MNKRAYHIPPSSAECRQCKSYRPDIGCSEISCIQLKAAINDGTVTYRDLLMTIYPQPPTLGWKIQELAGTYLGKLWNDTNHHARFHFLYSHLGPMQCVSPSEERRFIAALFLCTTSDELYKRTRPCFQSSLIDFTNCDDIWEHYDHEADAIVPGPSTQPLSKKIKVPDLDNWYRLQYHDTAKTNADHAVLFNLSQILYEVTGCIMPRKPERHLVALNTLYRYGINNKKANQNLLYCMALLAEAKHQSQFSQIPVSQESASEELPDAVDELKAQVIALREELSQCHQALQDVANKNSARTNQKEQLQRQLTHRDYLIHDLSTVVFNSKLPINPNGGNFPYRVASNY